MISHEFEPNLNKFTNDFDYKFICNWNKFTESDDLNKQE